ncbi:MAG: hypothetical protein FWG47_02750 [Propionibacteriaceae bacterium]|nr:hypothetical protein [Propionibacteriaceae bacterium]
MRRKSVFVWVVIAAIVVCVVGCVPVPTPSVSLSPTVTGNTSPSVVRQFPVGHGQLVVEATGFVYFTYQLLFEGLRVRSDQPQVVLPVGDYTVTVYMLPDGVELPDSSASEWGGDEDPTTSYSAMVSVGDDLSSVVKAISTPRPLEKVVSVGSDGIVPVGQGMFLTYDVGDVLLFHDVSLADPRVLADDVYSVCNISDHEVIILAGGKAHIYDSVIGDLSVLKSNEVVLDRLPPVPGRCVPGGVQVVDDGRILRIGRDFVETIQLPVSEGIARGADDGFLADTASGAIAAVFCNDYGEDYDIPGVETVLVECALDLSFRERSHTVRIPLGVRWDIAAVSLSADGSKVAVVADNLVTVFEVETGQILYAMPNSYSLSVFWQGNNELLYIGESSEVGAGFNKLYKSVIGKSESYGMTDNAEVNVSILSGVVDGYLYFSGVTYDSATSERSFYRIKLD